MQVYAIFLVTLSLIEVVALIVAARETKSMYLWAAATRILIFTGVYLFIFIFHPPVEVSRSVSRPLFVIMQGIAAFAALDFLRRRFKNKIALIFKVLWSKDIE